VKVFYVKIGQDEVSQCWALEDAFALQRAGFERGATILKISCREARHDEMLMKFGADYQQLGGGIHE